MRKTLFFTIVLMFPLFSCNRMEPVTRVHTFNEAVWERFDPLNFDFPIKDPDLYYNIKMVVLHTEAFPSDALSVNVVMNTPSGEERIKDYNIILRDRNGIYLGKETDGLFTRIVTMREGLKFQKAGVCRFEIENLMTKYFTPGIIEFGIVLEPKAE
nr:hypothetical protein [Bacteroidota bacterium]